MAYNSPSGNPPNDSGRTGEREVGTLAQMLAYARTGKRSWIEPESLSEEEQEKFLITLAADEMFRAAVVNTLAGASL